MLTTDTSKFLRWLMSARAPNLMPLISKSNKTWLSEEERKQLIRIVRAELNKEGLGQNDRPTRYGIKLQEVIRELEGGPQLAESQMSLLERLVSERAPELVLLLRKIGEERLERDEREALRRVVSEEFLEKGLREDHEPTPYGKGLDDLIGALGRV